MLEDSIIASQDEEIRKLLIFQYHYTVPKFQREYSWIDEHVEEFMDDLMQHLKDNKNEHYFFGSIYLCRTNDKNMWIVVDGQQRLATTMIFLVVVRDLFMEYGAHDDANKINEHIQYELNSEKKFRLNLNSRNNDFFHNNILADHVGDRKKLFFSADTGEKKLANAYEKIYAFLKKKCASSENEKDCLSKIVNHFLEYFIVVVNVIKTYHDQHRIFNSMNHKGLRLSENDYVKNGIFEKIDQNDIDYSDDLWSRMHTNLERFGMDDDKFLRHYLLATDKRVAKKDVSKNILDQFESKNISPIQLLENLCDYSYYYWILASPSIEFENYKTILSKLNSLITLESEIVYPALMVGYEKLWDSNEKEFEELVDLLLKFFFRARTICNKAPNSLERVIVEICKKLSNDESLKQIKHYVRNSRQYPSSSEFLSFFDSFSPKHNVALYTLQEINIRDQNLESFPTTQIDYVMPRKLSSAWKQYVKSENNLVNNMIQKFHGDNINKIGNIVLLDKNIKTSDTFENKKLVYKNSNIDITKNISKYETWNGDSIVQHQKSLGNIAEKIWNI